MPHAYSAEWKARAARLIKADPWATLPKTQPVWTPLKQVRVTIGLGAETEEMPRHKPHEFARAGTPIGKKDAPRIFAIARELNGQTKCLLASGLVVLETLIFKRWNKYTGRCDPSAVTLARHTGLSVRTVFRALARLRAAGLLSWRRRFQNSNCYAIGVNCQKGSESPDSSLIERGNRLLDALRLAATEVKVPLSLLSAYKLGSA